MNPVAPGTYRHKKGGRYLVLHNTTTVHREYVQSMSIPYAVLYVAKHADDGRMVMVIVELDTGWIAVMDGGDSAKMGEHVAVYFSLDHRQMWVRRTTEFHDVVEWPDGVERRRFVAEDFDA